MPYPQNANIQDNLLTTVVRGYKGNEYVGERLFPTVKVDKETGKYIQFGKDMFRSYDTLRGIGSESKRITGDEISTAPYQLEEHSLERALDLREIAESNPKIYNKEAKAIKRLTNSIQLGLEKEQAALATNLNSYGDNNKATISGTFYDDASFDFVKDIAKKIEKVKNDIAVNPNTLLMDERVWYWFKFHPILRSYLLGNNDNDKFIGKVADLESILDISIVIAKSKTSPDDTALSSVWQNNIIIAYVAPPTPLGNDEEEPSFGYTFKHSKYPLAERYEEERSSSIVLRSKDMYQPKIVGPESGFLIKNPINPANF